MGPGQGLLAATGASMRAKLRAVQAAQPRLQSRVRRERAQAALLDAATAVQAAQDLTQGGSSLLPQSISAAGTCPCWHVLVTQDEQYVSSTVSIVQTWCSMDAALRPPLSHTLDGADAVPLIRIPSMQAMVSPGPVSAARFACLALCMDAVAATGQVPAAELARVGDMLSALRTLTYLQPTLEQVPHPQSPGGQGRA